MSVKNTILILLILLAACQDWNYERVSFPQVFTRGATEVTANTARLEGTIFGLKEGENVSQHGHVWSAENPEPTLENKEDSTGKGLQSDGQYTSEAKGLRPNTRYYYRAYAVYQNEPIYGIVDTFTTRNFLLAIDTIQVNRGAAVVEWEVVSYLGDPDDFGVMWSATNELPTIDGESVSRTRQSAPFLNCTDIRCQIPDTLSGLEPTTNYYLRAYLFPGQGQPPVYSDVVHFHTFPESVGWSRMRDFPAEGFLENFAVSVAGKAYLGSGEGVNATSFQSKLWEYDPNQDSWTSVGDIPAYVDPGSNVSVLEVDASSPFFHVDGKVYFGPQAYNMGSYPAQWVYDPADEGDHAKDWQRLNEFPSGIRYVGAPVSSFSLADKGYMVLNMGDGTGTVWESTPTNNALQWRTLLTFTEPSPAQTPDYWINRNLAVGDKAYLLLPDRQVWAFDPDAPAFTPVDDFPEYWPMVAFAVNGRLYAGPGQLEPGTGNPKGYRSAARPVNHFWELDPQRPTGHQWRRMPDFPGGSVHFRSGFSVNDAGYLVFAGNGNRSTGSPEFISREVWRFKGPQ